MRTCEPKPSLLRAGGVSQGPADLSSAASDTYYRDQMAVVIVNATMRSLVRTSGPSQRSRL
eukprot:scaffold102525_cov72-Phaeocystis_antarctica.AAC.3